MKRTYVVPMCVLAGLLVLCGIAGFVLSGILEGMLEQTDELFVSEYKEPGDYHALYTKALALREKVSFERKDRSYFTSAASLTLGLLLVWWAFDRRRLIRRCQQSAPQEAEAAT